MPVIEPGHKTIAGPVKCTRCNTIFPEGRTTPCPIRITQAGYDSDQTRRCNGVRRPLTAVERTRLDAR